MSCLKCEHCEWNGVLNVCTVHPDFSLIDMCFRACKDFVRIYGVDNPENDTPQGMIVEIGKSWGDKLPDDASIEIYYYED